MEASRGTIYVTAAGVRAGVLYDHRRGFFLVRVWYFGHLSMEPRSGRVESGITRRQVVAGTLAAASTLAAGNHKALEAAGASDGRDGVSPFLLGLNTSTIRGQKLPIVQEIEIAAKAGYQGMEPWIDELRRYAEEGGSLEGLGKRFRDAGISVESAIDFFEWAVDDEGRRKKAMEAARKSLEIVRKIGGKRLAAPPVGEPTTPWNRCAWPSATAPCSSLAIRWAWYRR